MVEGRIIGRGGEDEARDRVGRFLSALTPTEVPFEGAANINRVYADPAGKVGEAGARYLYRQPKDRTGVIQELKKWYKGVGFTATGGSFRYLSNAEQAKKMRKMHSVGLKTVVPAVSVGEEMILPFIEGETLLDYRGYTLHTT